MWRRLSRKSVTNFSRVASPFCALTMAQIVDGRVLCVHGGLSPDVRTLDQIRTIQRCQEIPHEGAFCGMCNGSASEHTVVLVK